MEEKSFRDRSSSRSEILGSEEPGKIEEERKVCETGAERAGNEVH